MDSTTSITYTHVEEEIGHGQHIYPHMEISGNARVQNGNIYIREFHGPLPDSLPSNIQLNRNGALENTTRPPRKRKRSVCEGGDRRIRKGNPFLVKAISHLGELSTSIRGHKHNEAAEKIVSRILTILKAIDSNGDSLQSGHTKKELARMRKGLTLTNSVGINSMVDRRLPEQVIEAKRKCSMVALNRWDIFLDTKMWEALDEHGRKISGSFSALHLEPLDFTSASPIAAFFGETIDHLSRTSVIHPAVLSYRTVSNQSEVFKVIKRDDIARLKELILHQEATMWDCDEEGRTLLHVSAIDCRNLELTDARYPSMHAAMTVSNAVHFCLNVVPTLMEWPDPLIQRKCKL